ncbi:MAG TPA: hypothetical protein VFQ67_13635 [Allosphingosinicella sp.]|nr:hypothetical protein [Allosphingosinicella sp.]
MLFAALLLAGAVLPAPVAAQPPRAASAAQPVPDQLTLAKLIWSTMAAVDQANRTGNYSVLRELGSAGFQAGNTPVNLAAVFGRIREQRIDLSDTFLLEPLLDFPARIEGGLLRIRGAFRMRPTGIQFDLLYQWDGGWRLHAIALNPVAMNR